MNEYLAVAVILGQLGIIYGLINRLIKQSGQSQMQVAKAVQRAIDDTVGVIPDGKVEAAPRQIAESFRIGV